MNKYEVMVITKANLEEKAQDALISSLEEVFKNSGATIVETNSMGQKEFAYEINHMKQGVYTAYVVEASADTISEFKRVCNINEDVIRHLIINLEK
ncbi:MAG: 30S ribosomal protein S6 [Bacilli bacterium]